MIKRVLFELKIHAPFTFLGALTGILLFFFLKRIPSETSFQLFYVFHPLHVFFSAFVTASMYKMCAKNPTLPKLFAIGILGSIGIGTVSDSLIPYLGEILLKMPHAHAHIGFIEKWYLVNPLAIAGILLGNFFPSTKFPHMGHVLLSTWASLFHMMMSVGTGVTAPIYFLVLLILFLSVWLPCCVSDIVFPLLFIKDKDALEKCSCTCHGQ